MTTNQDTETPASRLRQLMDEDDLSGVALVNKLIEFDPEHYKPTYTTNISRFINGKNLPSKSFLMSVQQIFGYNHIWILFGKGQPRINPKTGSHIDLPLLPIERQGMKIDLADPSGWGPKHRLYGSSLSRYKDDFIIEISDQAMAPQLNPTSRVRCRLIQSDQWATVGGVIACCYSHKPRHIQIIVRRVKESGMDDRIRLVADNGLGTDHTVAIDQIRWLAQVERIVDAPVV